MPNRLPRENQLNLDFEAGYRRAKRAVDSVRGCLMQLRQIERSFGRANQVNDRAPQQIRQLERMGQDAQRTEQAYRSLIESTRESIDFAMWSSWFSNLIVVCNGLKCAGKVCEAVLVWNKLADCIIDAMNTAKARIGALKEGQDAVYRAIYGDKVGAGLKLEEALLKLHKDTRDLADLIGTAVDGKDTLGSDDFWKVQLPAIVKAAKVVVEGLDYLLKHARPKSWTGKLAGLGKVFDTLANILEAFSAGFAAYDAYQQAAKTAREAGRQEFHIRQMKGWDRTISRTNAQAIQSSIYRHYESAAPSRANGSTRLDIRTVAQADAVQREIDSYLTSLTSSLNHARSVIDTAAENYQDWMQRLQRFYTEMLLYQEQLIDLRSQVVQFQNQRTRSRGLLIGDAQKATRLLEQFEEVGPEARSRLMTTFELIASSTQK